MAVKVTASQPVKYAVCSLCVRCVSALERRELHCMENIRCDDDKLLPHIDISRVSVQMRQICSLNFQNSGKRKCTFPSSQISNGSGANIKVYELVAELEALPDSQNSR